MSIGRYTSLILYLLCLYYTQEHIHITSLNHNILHPRTLLEIYYSTIASLALHLRECYPYVLLDKAYLRLVVDNYLSCTE